MEKQRPLIAHVIFRLNIGGLENGLVNIINRMPEDRYRHAIICLTDATDFRKRIHREGVEIYTMNMREGHDFMVFIRLFRLFRKIKPTLVHTRNLAAIECQLPAFLAGVPCRVHGEHGWDVYDPEGNNKKYQWLRRLLSPLVHRFIPLSQQLEDYLLEKVGISRKKIIRICNGVDTTNFYPPRKERGALSGCPYTDKELVLIGAVGRMHGVKDQVTLVRAFARLIEKSPELCDRCRLLLVGDGPLRDEIQEMLGRLPKISSLVWLPGERNDVAEILRGLDIFVLPSQAEGISNTILEAMASALPVIATQVGGNPDLVDHGKTGLLVPPNDPEAMAVGLQKYVTDRELARSHGDAGLRKVTESLGLDTMVNQYLRVYDQLSKSK